MDKFSNKIVFVKNIPETKLVESDFEGLQIEENFSLGEGQVLVKSITMSFDGSQRIWFYGSIGLYDAIKSGQPMLSRGVGRVEQTKSEKFKKGELIVGVLKWKDFHVYHETELKKIEIDHELKNHYISWHTYFTAYFGLTKIAQLPNSNINPELKKRILISAAGGATGSAACQLARAWGHEVVGISGGKEKCQLLKEAIGIEVYDYKGCEDRETSLRNLKKALSEKYPGGFDIYFDNVGGAQLDLGIELLKQNSLIVACGAISIYDSQLK